ncbi:MAG: hypothetical protein ABFS17_07090 [Chloroflexota bacterium]
MRICRFAIVSVLVVLLLAACNMPGGEVSPDVGLSPDIETPKSTTTAEPTATLRPTLVIRQTSDSTATPMMANWNHVGMPAGAAKVFYMLVHPEDDDLWYVMGHQGDPNLSTSLFLSEDAGASWKIVYTGVIMRPLVIDPADGNILYSDDDGKLLRSTDRGQTWTVIHQFSDMVESIHISTIDGAIYIGQRWYNNTNPGIYRSDDGGENWSFFPFGANTQHFIPWDIEEDPNNGNLYVVIEIADHPKPYDPPFYRSTDRGETWEEVGGDLTWHGFTIQVNPLNSHVYFLSEGNGLFKSTDEGLSWARINNSVNFARGLVLDPRKPARFIGVDLYHQPLYDGGVYYSEDYGKSFLFLGLEGHNTTGITLNSSSTMMYLVSYDQGIYTSPIPAP